MSKYIEFDVVIQKKSKRKTRRKRGGGDITKCDLTPLTHEVTVADLKAKIRSPERLDNLTVIPSELMSGAYNIARPVTCTTKSRKSKQSASEKIICRFWKKAFYVEKSGSIRFVDLSELDEYLNRFAEELSIAIEQDENTLPMYDIKAVSLENKLLNILNDAEKREIFGQPPGSHTLADCVCLCVIMKKGEPYEITLENFRKTMLLLERIGEKYLYVDIKTDNFLCSKDSEGTPNVVIIDFDPKLILMVNLLNDIIIDKVLLSICIMKYLFCIFLLINIDFYDESFIDVIITELEGIINEQIRLTSGATKSVLFIITSFYNPNNGLSLPKNIRIMFRMTFYTYSLAKVTKISLALYMKIRKYVIDCPEKAMCEERYLQSIGNINVKYDNVPKSLRYIMNHQCRPGPLHSITLTLFSGFHSCFTELTEVEWTYEEDTQNIMFSYRMDGKLYSKILSQPKKRVAEDAAEYAEYAEDAAKYESKVVKQAPRKMVRAKGPT